MKRSLILVLIVLGVIGFVLVVAFLPKTFPSSTPPVFDGERAFRDVEYQLSLGPRLIGSEAHNNLVNWLGIELGKAKWDVEIQETSESGVPIRNVIAKRGQGTPWIILGAHYDSRFWADQDPDPEKRRNPVMGANDGASGVAILLELARVIPDDFEKRVWFIFFDGEDNGNIPGYDWILGSKAFVDNLSEYPNAVIIVDMVGDRDLNIYMEKNSDAKLMQEIWSTAAKLGYENHFIPSEKYSILDDHTPFLEVGIRAVDIIDFDYSYWHTTQDTLDKVSPDSLQVVGSTLLEWMKITNLVD